MKDLILKILESMFKAFFKVALEAVKNVDYKKVVYSSYMSYRPELEKKVEDSESKIDDAALKAFDVIVNKFFKPEENA